ncbi:ac75 [Artaxa digramma nucleopolyhedrovirus]|uniref:Ac75 n=1 Tax=Artaxa digramma nucleopolyhedrovirus TaxID=3070910 RepID=A0AAE6UZM9_9ABAC|nr:ac75 [Euproctis digramma nucleopolyhedrovirus]QHB21730.1 ac75 [Artaxa digramma nucleopolyhedrovirus]
MELFKNFVDNVVQSMPHVSKVAYVSTQLKKYLIQLNEDENEQFHNKFIIVLEKFTERQLTLDQMCMLVEAADGFDLTKSQINYFCNKAYLDDYLIDLLQTYVKTGNLNNDDIHYIANFLIVEINKAIINN